VLAVRALGGAAAALTPLSQAGGVCHPPPHSPPPLFLWMSRARAGAPKRLVSTSPHSARALVCCIFNIWYLHLKSVPLPLPRLNCTALPCCVLQPPAFDIWHFRFQLTAAASSQLPALHLPFANSPRLRSGWSKAQAPPRFFFGPAIAAGLRPPLPSAAAAPALQPLPAAHCHRALNRQQEPPRP
jgi:hypothetical protein